MPAAESTALPHHPETKKEGRKGKKNMKTVDQDKSGPTSEVRGGRLCVKCEKKLEDLSSKSIVTGAYHSNSSSSTAQPQKAATKKTK